MAYGLYDPAEQFNFKSSMGIASLYNKNLTWEETKQFNVGIDLDFFNYRLGVVFDYYKKMSDKMLMNAFLPGDYSGINQVMTNSGKLSNDGMELTIKADVIRNDNWFYRINFNIARNWNKFLDSYNHQDYGKMVIGRPVNGIYVFETDGIYESMDEVPYTYRIDGSKMYLNNGLHDIYAVGDPKIVDQNLDYEIDNNDLIYLGSALPVAVGGMVHDVKYKNFDLSCYWTFSIGKNILDNAIGSALAPSNYMLNKAVLVNPYEYTFWEERGDEGKVQYPMHNALGVNAAWSPMLDRYVKKVSYAKLKSITIGYTLPEKYCKILKLNKVRAFLSAENILTISNFTKLDPEAVDIKSGVASLRTYPLARRLTFGLTVNL